MIKRLLCMTLALVACDSAADSTATTVVDSAGIPIATALAPVWGSGDGWTIAEEPLVQIGSVDGADEYVLGGVRGVVRLGGGDIVVGDWTSSIVRRYDAEGTFVWEAGGGGEGPGEHLRITWLGVLPGDSIVTWDQVLARVQVFGPDGRVARTMRLEIPWTAFNARAVLGLSGRQLVMSLGDHSGEMPEGAVRWPGQRIATVSMDDGTVSDLIDVPGAEQHIARYGGEQVLFSGYTYGKGPEFAVADRTLSVVDTEAFSIRSISLDDGSTSRIVRRDVPIVAVSEEHVEAYLDWMVWRNHVWGGMSMEDAESYRPTWRESPMAPTLPVLQTIHLDAAGNLWVVPFTLPGTDFTAFEVHAPDGTWLGSVPRPPGLGSDQIEIGDDYVLGVWTDEQDVEHVRLHRLEK